MNTALKVAVFASGLALAFGAAYGVGHAVGSTPAPAGRAHQAHDATAAPEGRGGREEHPVGGL